MSLRKHHWVIFVIHSAAVCAAISIAWLLRFDFSLPDRQLLLLAAPILVAVRWAAMYRYHLTHGYWRHTGIGDVEDLMRALLLGSVIFFFLIRVVFGIRAFPYSVYILETMLSFFLLAGLRVGARMIAQRRAVQRLGDPVPVLIVGAGEAAVLLLQAMKQTNFVAVGLVDDDQSKQKLKFGGVSVLGRIDQLPLLVRRHVVSEILIAIPSATGVQMLHITDSCRQAGVPFRAVPCLASLVSGKLNIEELHDVNLDDLLGREPVVDEPDSGDGGLRDRVVMVTGAAGSIGSELCRHIIRCRPKKLICLDQSETPLFHLQQSFLQQGGVDIVYSVADITDTDNMRYQLSRHCVEVVFHAAAYKHVPMTEANPHEGLKNNVFGLLDLVEVAEQCGCEEFVLISSDKAVNPSSLMGCTKRLGEMIVGSRPASHMRCVSVRFGNVLGSQGSVVPIFQEQIRSGGAVTVTHPQMTRYFMTIPEAAFLVLKAFTVGEHGDILVLDMGKPVRIVDLARTLMRVLGKTESEVRIVYSGMRPGEKLHEELFYSSETPSPTALAKVLRAQSHLPAWPLLCSQLRELRVAASSQGADQIRNRLKQIIPEYEWEPTAPLELVPNLVTYAMPAGLAEKTYASLSRPA